MKKSNIRIIIIISISIIVGIYLIAVNNHKETEYIYDVSKDVLETLYTSDFSRYERYLKTDAKNESFAADTDFSSSKITQEYIKLYENNCTRNCIISMNNSNLLTYVDYLSFLAQENIYFKSMNLIEKDVPQHNNLYKSKEFYYTVTMVSSQNEEFEVHGEICGSFIENEYKIYFLTLSDYHSLSIHVTGENIFQY